MNAQQALADTGANAVSESAPQPLNPRTLAAAIPTPGEYLAFTLADQSYAVDILRVQEIRNIENITRLPNTQQAVRGVINLRGAIVPVIDLRLRLGLGEGMPSALTVMIVLNVGDRTVGMVVDSVSDVVQVEPTNIRPAPAVGASAAAQMLAGVGVVEPRMLLLLDLDRVFCFGDVENALAA